MIEEDSEEIEKTAQGMLQNPRAWAELYLTIKRRLEILEKRQKFQYHDKNTH